MGPDADGIFSNIPHVFAYVWSADEWLSGIVPVSSDETENQFHPYGVNHITDAELLSKGAAYVVVDDLTSSAAVRRNARYGVWPHRVRVYAHASDGMLMAQDMVTQFLDKLKQNGRQATHVGGICRIEFTGRRNYQSQNHYVSQVTVRPSMRG